MTDTAYCLPVIDTIKTAWAKVKGAKGTIWSVLGIVFLLEFCMGILSGIFEEPNGQLPLFVSLISMVVGTLVLLLSWGLLYIGIQRAAGQPIQFSLVTYIFSWSVFFRMVALYILQILMFLVVSILLALSFFLQGAIEGPAGTVLAVVVYIVWLVLFLYVVFRLYLAKALVLAKQMGPIVALKASFVATKGNVWSLIGITILSLLIFFVSLIPLGIGLIWSLPFIFINYGEVFKRLVSER